MTYDVIHATSIKLFFQTCVYLIYNIPVLEQKGHHSDWLFILEINVSIPCDEVVGMTTKGPFYQLG